MPRRPSVWWVAGTAAVLSTGLNIDRALDYPFWQDEVGSARAVTAGGPIAMLRVVVGTELHPPGFYTLVWFLDAVGAPVVWGRSISVLASAALSGLLVLYARRFVPLWGAALVGLASALGWQFVAHGWELRSYALFALACLGFVLALEWAFEQPTRTRLALLVLAVAVGAMAHYFFVFTLVGGLVWVFNAGSRARIRPLLAAVGLGLLPLLIWLPGLYKQYEEGSLGRYPDFRLMTVLESYSSLLARSLPSGVWGDVAALLILGLVLVGAVRLWRASPAGRLCALSALVPVALAAFAWLVGPDIFVTRNLIGAAPFAVVAIAAAIAALPRPAALGGAAAAAALLAVLYLDTDGPIVPAYDRVASALVQEGWQEEDPILLFGPLYEYLHPLDWYLPGTERLEVVSWTGQRPCGRVYVVAVGGQARALIAGAGAGRRRVGRIEIARLDFRETLPRETRLRNGHVLAGRGASCVRT